MSTLIANRNSEWATDGQFGERVYLLRSKLAMSRHELGEKAKVSAKTIGRWERDEMLPRTGQTLRDAAEALGTTPGFLLLGEADDGE